MAQENRMPGRLLTQPLGRPRRDRTSRGTIPAYPAAQSPPASGPDLPAKGVWPNIRSGSIQPAALPRSRLSSARPPLASVETATATPQFAGSPPRTGRPGPQGSGSAASGGDQGGVRLSSAGRADRLGRPSVHADGGGVNCRRVVTRQKDFHAVLRSFGVLRTGAVRDSGAGSVLLGGLSPSPAAGAGPRAQVASPQEVRGAIQTPAGIRGPPRRAGRGERGGSAGRPGRWPRRARRGRRL